MQPDTGQEHSPSEGAWRKRDHGHPLLFPRSNFCFFPSCGRKLFFHLRDLHLTQVVEAAPDAEAGDPRHSILTACMSDGDKSRKLYFTPAAWLSCLSTSDGVMAFTEGEWQNWFCSFLGVPLPSMLALIANNRKCPCGRPYDAHAHHVNTCIHCNKTRAHNLLQDCLMSIARDTDFNATPRVPTFEVNDRLLRADMYLPHMERPGVVCDDGRPKQGNLKGFQEGHPHAQAEGPIESLEGSQCQC